MKFFDKNRVLAGNVLTFFAVLALLSPAEAGEFIISSGGSIQAALNAAQAGDTVSLRGDVYYEKIFFPRSGNASAGFITLRSWPGETAILDGAGIAGECMITIEDKNFIRICGLEIRNNTGVADGSGIRILGASCNIEILTNSIHDMRGVNAMAITVYGTSAAPATNIVICGNHVYDCEPAESEAIALNGNISGFEVSCNYVHDVNNIGIVFIGGETDISPYGVCRNGLCRGNRVCRARSNYGGGYAAGIYVDGGRDIILEQNMVWESDIGMEIGAENAGIVVTGVIARSNILFNNDKAGLAFGGYEQSRGRVQACRFLNNTCYKNDTLCQGNGELWIQWASDNIVENNIFYCGAQGKLINSQEGNQNNRLDYNLWFCESGANSAMLDWNGSTYNYEAYRTATGQDSHSLFANPCFANASATNFHPMPNSPAIDAGNPAYEAKGETDFEGKPRVCNGRIDAGAYENQSSSRSDNAVQLYLPPSPVSAQNPAFSPDGKFLVFTLFHTGYNSGPAGLYKIPTTGGTPSTILYESDQDSVNLPGSCWNGLINRIVFSSDRQDIEEIWTIAPDGTNPFRVTTHTGNYYYLEPSFSPDGQWIVFERRGIDQTDESPGSILKVKTDGTALTVLTDNTASGFDDRQPNWSPKGDRILFQRRVAGSADWNIYTMLTDGAGISQVTFDKSADTDASWSPDGNWIVYSTDYGGLPQPNIFIIPASNGAPLRITASLSCEDCAPSWSPDGQWIAFESHTSPDESSRAALWRIPVAFTSSVPTPTGLTASDSAFSDHIHLSWNSMEGDVAEYELWRSPRNATWSAEKIAETTANTYDDFLVARGTFYYYWLKAKSASGTSGFSLPALGRRKGLPAGYDADGTSDLAVYDNSTGYWYVYSLWDNVLFWGVHWGFSGASPVAGDYDGDGLNDFAIYDTHTGLWYVLNTKGVVIAWAYAWGWPGAWPVPGDYDGDGRSDCAVFDQNTGWWFVIPLNSSTPLAWAFAWGWPGAWPVPGDYDGDGKSDCAVFDQNTGWWFVIPLNSSTPLAWAFAWGWPGAWPVPGDYDGDGKSDCAVFDQNTGWWFVIPLNSSTPLAWAFAWGWPGAWPVSGDYDGDGCSDFAVFDQNTGWWFVITRDMEILAWAFAWGWPGAWPVGVF